MKPSLKFLTVFFALSTCAVTYRSASADPDPEVCYERCLELVEKGKIKDKKDCDFCKELKKKKDK